MVSLRIDLHDGGDCRSGDADTAVEDGADDEADEGNDADDGWFCGFHNWYLKRIFRRERVGRRSEDRKSLSC